jgi:hypothetical protein
LIFVATITSIYALWIWLNYLLKVDVFKQVDFKKIVLFSIFGVILGGAIVLVKYYFNRSDLINFSNIYIQLSIKSLIENGILTQIPIFLLFLFFFRKYKNEFKDHLHFFLYFNAIALGVAASEMIFNINNRELFNATFEACFIFLSQIFHGFFVIYFILRSLHFNKEWNNKHILPWVLLTVFFSTFYSFFNELNQYESGAIYIGYLYIFLMSTLFNKLLNNILNTSKAFTYHHQYNPNKNIKFLFLHFFILLLIETMVNAYNYVFIYGYYLSVLEIYKTGLLLVIVVIRLNSIRFESGKWGKFVFELPFYLKSIVNYETSNTSSSIAFKGDSYKDIYLDNYIGTTLEIQSVSTRNNYLDDVYRIKVIDKFYLKNVQVHFRIELINHHNFNVKEEYFFTPKIYGITNINNKYPIVALLQVIETNSSRKENECEFLEWSYLIPLEK